MTSHTLIAYTRMFLNVSKQESRIHYKVIKRAQVIQLTKCHLRVDAFKARIFILEIFNEFHRHSKFGNGYKMKILLVNFSSISILEHCSDKSCLMIVYERACHMVWKLI